MHALDHQLDVVEGGTCGREAGAGLDVVSARLADDVAHLFLLLVGQQTGLDDDLEHLVAHCLFHGANVLADGVVLLVLQAADVDDHVHLGSAVLNGLLGLERLGLGVHGAQREANDAAHRDAASQILHGLFHIAGVDADGSRVIFHGLVADNLDLRPSGLRLEQSVIHMGENFFTSHVCFSFLLAGTAHLCHADSTQGNCSCRDRCTNDAQHQTGDQKCKTFQTTLHKTVPPKMLIFFKLPSSASATQPPPSRREASQRSVTPRLPLRGSWHRR